MKGTYYSPAKYEHDVQRSSPESTIVSLVFGEPEPVPCASIFLTMLSPCTYTKCEQNVWKIPQETKKTCITHLQNLSKDNVFSVEMRRGHGRDEKLRTVGTRSSCMPYESAAI
jgi:hypothetical protein